VFGRGSLRQHPDQTARVLTAVSRGGSNEQVGDHAILGWNNHGAISAIVIENPSCQKKRGSLVCFTEYLSSRYAKCQDRRVDTFLYAVYRRERPTQSIQIIGFIEPFVLASKGRINDCGDT
jgi:hypothetical protein